MNQLAQVLWWAVRPLWVWRLVRLLVRAAWLGGLVALSGWLLSAAAGRALGAPEWLLLGGLAALLIFVAQALWPVRARGLAHRLDRRYQLRDQLTAAYEVAERGPRNYVEQDLLAAAADTLRDLRRQWRWQVALPWNDLLLAVVVGTALAAVGYGLAARQAAPAPNITHAAYAALPPVGLEPLVDLPGAPAEYQARTGQVAAASSAESAAADSAGLGQATAAQDVLDALAEALSIPSLTQGAGQALAQGDGERAAAELRQLAQQADGISSDARQALSDALGQAAERLDSSAPQAAEELRRDGGALTQDPASGGGDAATADALESLAQMIESAQSQRDHPTTTQDAAGDSSGGGGSDSGQGSQGADSNQGQPGDTPGAQSGANGTAGDRGAPEESSTGSLDSLRASGSTVALPPSESLDPGSLRPADNPGQAHARRSVPYTYLEAAGAGGAQPSDPLSIPWRLRNVIQRYFSPP